MDKTKDTLEIHMGEEPKKGLNARVVLLQGTNFFRMDGVPIKPDEVRVCDICFAKAQPGQIPEIFRREIDFAKHMVEAHPKKTIATPKDAPKKKKTKKKG